MRWLLLLMLVPAAQACATVVDDPAQDQQAPFPADQYDIRGLEVAAVDGYLVLSLAVPGLPADAPSAQYSFDLRVGDGNFAVVCSAFTLNAGSQAPTCTVSRRAADALVSDGIGSVPMKFGAGNLTVEVAFSMLGAGPGDEVGDLWARSQFAVAQSGPMGQGLVLAPVLVDEAHQAGASFTLCDGDAGSDAPAVEPVDEAQDAPAKDASLPWLLPLLALALVLRRAKA